MHKNTVVPRGSGFEVDYDAYNSKQGRKFKTAEDWWFSFSKHFNKEFEGKSDLLSITQGDEPLARVIYHFVGDNYETWMSRKDIDGLGGLSPKECLEAEWSLKRLRMLFLQSH
mgnify:CR=1 FL=1